MFNLTTAEAQTVPIYVIDANTGGGYIPANLLQVELREFEILLQNNLLTERTEPRGMCNSSAS
jgi:hypothetical protein